MKKDKKTSDTAATNKPQTGSNIKKGLPVKNPTTDPSKNSATQTPGLNQEKDHKR
jgi:hypothetical protein